MNIVESFLNFIETNGKSANYIEAMILERLEKRKDKIEKIDIRNCRGQVYYSDGWPAYWCSESYQRN